MTDREELTFLRVSVARLAQAAGIETKTLRVLDKETRELFVMAATKARGWNELSAKVADYLKRSVIISKGDARVLAKALRAYDKSDFASALILKLLGKN